MADLKQLRQTLETLALNHKQQQADLEEAIRTAKNETDRARIMKAIGESLGAVFQPYFDKLEQNNGLTGQELKRIISESVNVNVPGVDTSPIAEAVLKAVSGVKIEAPNVSVTVPELPAPIVNMPPVSFPDSMSVDGEVKIKGVDKTHPMPVMLMGLDGKPFSFSQQSGGGGRSDFFTIKDIQNSSGGSLIDNDGNLKVAGTFNVSAAGSTYAFLTNADGPITAANPLPTSASVTLSAATGQGDTASALRTVQAGDSVSSVVVNSGTITAVTGITNSVAAALVDSTGVAYSGSNPLPTTASVSLTLPSGPGDGATATRFIQAGDTVSSVIVNSGSLTSLTTLTSITNSVASALVDSSGVAYSGSNPLPTTASVSLTLATGQGDGASATRFIQAGDTVSSVVVNSGTITTVTTLTGVTNSIATVLTDSSGVQYSGSNPVPTSASLSVPQGQGDAAVAMRVVVAGNSDASVVVNSGTITTVTTLTGITNSVSTALTDSTGVQYSGSNPVPINNTQWGGVASATGLNETNAGVVRVVQMSDTASSVVVNSGTITTVTTLTGITNSVAANIVDSSGVAYSGSNPLPTSASLSVPQGQGDAATAMRVVIAGNSDASVIVNSGTITTVTTLTGITNSVAATIVDSTGIAYSGSNPFPVSASLSASAVQVSDGQASTISSHQFNTDFRGLDVYVGGFFTSVAANIIDSSGVAYSGTNPVPVSLVSGALTSTVVVGDTLARTADIGAAPLKVGGIARTTQPTSYTDGDRSNFTTDKLGRQLIRPLQVRDLVSTAFVQLTTGSETTLLGASTGQQFDLIWILLSNESTAAVQVDLRGVTGGNKMMSFQVPANGTVGIAPPVPLPNSLSDTGNAWTVDMPDITGTTVDITALFTREI